MVEYVFSTLVKVSTTLGIKYTVWLLKFLKPITVSTKTIRLGSSNWKGKPTFNIENRFTVPIHGLWISISLDQSKASGQNIKVEELGQDAKDLTPLELPAAMISADFSFFGLDNQNREARFMYLREVQQRSIRKFLVEYSGDIPQGTTLTAAVKVAGFSREPVTPVVRPGETSIPFRPPENSQVIKGASLIIKRKE